MKTFINVFREYKNFRSMNSKFVWNPETKRWLTTFQFSTKHITSRGLEVVCG